jgi:peptidoglycan/xylan/chitin deacetylase (PgdA/CDA1 family)
VALTLDACSGKFDDDLIEYLISKRIPATIFATKKWLDRNPYGLSVIKKHLDLFDVEDMEKTISRRSLVRGKRYMAYPVNPMSSIFGVK